MAAPLVLAVDDNRDICDMLGDGLAMYGYRAECAISAEAALELTRLHAFDLAVVDLRLRGSMCGDALALALTKLAIPVILVSGIIDAEERLMKLPYPYLLKPYHWEALIALIGKTLGDQPSKPRRYRQRRSSRRLPGAGGRASGGLAPSPAPSPPGSAPSSLLASEPSDTSSAATGLVAPTGRRCRDP